MRAKKPESDVEALVITVAVLPYVLGLIIGSVSWSFVLMWLEDRDKKTSAYDNPFSYEDEPEKFAAWEQGYASGFGDRALEDKKASGHED